MIGSVLRGALVAAAVAVALALPRSLDLGWSPWIALLGVMHVALPFGAAFWGRRADTVTLDVGLAGIGIAYIGLMAFTPDASVWLYLVLPLVFTVYAVLATASFAGLRRWRTALRIRRMRRLREQARARPSTSVAA